MDQFLMAELADTLANTWNRRIARSEAVVRFITRAERGHGRDVAGSAAAEIGIARCGFRRLVKIRKTKIANVPAADRGFSCPTRIPDDQEAAIREALATERGCGNSTQVYREVLRICGARGIAAPSRSSVRDRFRDCQDRRMLKRFSPDRAGWILDSCELDLNIRAGMTCSQPAYLSALVASEDGRIISHVLTAGEPRSAHLHQLLATVPQSCEALPVVVMPAIAAKAPEVRRLLSNRFDLVSCAPMVGGNGHICAFGEALMRVFGRKIGRIKFRPRCGPRARNQAAVVDHDVASAVIQFLIDNHNRERTRTTK